MIALWFRPGVGVPEASHLTVLCLTGPRVKRRVGFGGELCKSHTGAEYGTAATPKHAKANILAGLEIRNEMRLLTCRLRIAKHPNRR